MCARMRECVCTRVYMSHTHTAAAAAAESSSIRSEAIPHISHIVFLCLCINTKRNAERATHESLRFGHCISVIFGRAHGHQVTRLKCFLYSFNEQPGLNPAHDPCEAVTSAHASPCTRTHTRYAERAKRSVLTAGARTQTLTAAHGYSAWAGVGCAEHARTHT